MHFILQILFWSPQFWRRAGVALFSSGTTLAILGWRLSSRIDRIEFRSGVTVDLTGILDGLPFFVPTTPAGIFFAVLLAIFGILLALAGRWASKFQ